MNSVHEPGPNGDSKISPSRKPIRKAKLDAQAPSGHAQVRAGVPRRAHGYRIVAGSPAVSWQGAGRVAGPSGRIVAFLPHAPRASACAPSAQRPSASACSPSTLARSAYRTPSAVSWPPSRPYRKAQRRVAARPWPYRGPRERAPCLPSCLATVQYFVLPPKSSLYLCNTNPCIATYFFQPAAIQFLALQYNWAVAQNSIFCTNIFFFVFLL